jgi:hypothetical protein
VKHYYIGSTRFLSFFTAIIDTKKRDATQLISSGNVSNVGRSRQRTEFKRVYEEDSYGVEGYFIQTP